ncbi:beta-glucosidase [Hufsiella ginkgonis]|uniref:Glycosyl hydrolase n=1 Tax=Hufsiella ginkgonis TaxID=2695274 RepID=A0A7K1XS17_9SPHI|nr:glycoside hydrolase family 3 C-terminal domain-containing protein [Hufsiella ginkgonis]MXV13783.1 glycosyl hydrolase [Hufsiella ginkgonis]
MIRMFFIASLALATFCTATAQDNLYALCDADFSPISLRKNLPAGAVYTDPKASAEARATDVVRRLTLEEKIMLTGGWKQMHFPGLPRLGLAPIYFSDASQGVHVKNICIPVGKTTAFPSTLALAATWNDQLAYRYAQAIGEECRTYGIGVLLGPGMNLYRNSEGGRNFEYMGEDPFLVSRLSVNYVKGVQQTGTVATIKHFIGNEQEFARHVANSVISERALREIYLPPYEASIKKGGALAVMTGNNLVNGWPGAANKPLVADVLRKEYNFKGTVMSDWASSQFWPDKQNLELGSGHSLLMDNNKIFADYVIREIAAHPEKKAEIEKQLGDMVRQNLYTFFKAGLYDKPYRDASLAGTFGKHIAISLKTAEESMTLLKNDDRILPLTPTKVTKIAVVGAAETLKLFAGRGSGAVEGYDHVDYLQGLQKVYGDKLLYRPDLTDDEVRSADAVLCFIAKHVREGADFAYPMPEADKLVARYAALNKNVVVIFTGGNGFSMPWLNDVKGLLFAYYAGQNSGDALANIVSGKVTPSGKLPFTIEKEFNDSPAKDFNKMADGNYYWQGDKGFSRQMSDKFKKIDVNYSEGIYIGYRWFEKKNITPQFPFGFGLSYTAFAYGPLLAGGEVLTRNTPVTLTLSLRNTGAADGAEVAQLYVQKANSVVDRPVKELKDYAKLFLKAGQSGKVTFTVDWEDLAFWNEKTHAWEVEKGTYQLLAGSSSAEIKVRAQIRVN